MGAAVVARWGRAAVAACCGLLLAGCGSGAEPAPRTAPQGPGPGTTTAAASGAAVAPVGVPAPLTGVPVSATVQRRPVLAVAVGSSPAPRGLDRADIVVEEVSSPPRYVALFQSRDSDTVGPVVQTRPVDAQLLSGGGRPAIAYTGGPKGFVTQLQRAGAVDLGLPTQPAAYRQSGADYYVATPALFGLARGATPATPRLSYAEAGQALATKGVAKAARVTVTIPGAATQQWAYAPATKTWQRSDVKVPVTNLVFQTVEYRQIEVQKGSGVLVPSARVAVGDGKSTVVSGPSAVTGQWIRKGVKQVTNFLDAAGVPVRLAAGSTWVVLLPPGSAVTVR